MVTIRSVNEIIQNLVDFFRVAQPDLDTKPGTVARDLFVDAPASMTSLLYDELSGVSNQQSLRLVVGADLDRLAKNFGLVRKQSTPSTGVSLLTFSAINANININKGDSVIAGNGFSFNVTAGLSVTASSSNYYRSVASKFRDQLDFVGISDEFAVEVTVLASTPGTAGNIGPYSLDSTSIPGVSNVTNINLFTGGTDQENDALFRNRILSAFSGSSVGTALGYLNIALSTTGVSDAAVIEPGNPLMTRDGTVVKVNADGSSTIVSEGSGGKVDVIVLGSNLVENIDTFIYKDKSNNNNPSSSKNDFVLGQIPADANKTINRKRIDDIQNGVLPAQPVNELLQVTGSLSGANFAVKTTDSYGRVFGNYELLKDEGAYGGSPWGFDTFHWISNKISNFGEDRIKGQYNGQDAVTFTDVLGIPKIQQNLSITNENSTVTSNRSIIQLLHTPVTNVTRVFNVNTGERYIITNQNLDQTGTFNTTGRIQISGNTLPSQTEVLQVDYSWIVNYDPYSDYDGLVNTSNPRPVTDSTDWGYASVVNSEKIIFSAVVGNNFYQGTAVHPVGTVVKAEKFYEVNGTVATVTSGTFINRLSVTINRLPVATSTVESITLKNSNVELFATAQADTTITTATQVVGIEILYMTTIILPSDTVAQVGDKVSVILNSSNVFSSDTVSGSSSGNQITIPSSLIDTSATEIALRVTYISSVSDLFSSATTSLPTSRSGNGYVLNSNSGFTNFSSANESKRENQTVQKNLSNQYYVDLTALSVDTILTADLVVAVVRLSDGLFLWDANNPGTVTTNVSGNYELIFSGYNSPAINDKVLVIYYTNDIKRFQPFSYYNSPIKTRIDSLSLNSLTNQFELLINSFTNEAPSLTFSIIEPNTNIELFSITDGYMNGFTSYAEISSGTVNFSTLADLINKKVKILGSSNPNNDGLYDILSYNVTTNIIQISNIMAHLTKDQVSVVRLLDGKEIWNYSGTIDSANNKIAFPVNSFTSAGDQVFVMFFNYSNLRKAPTKIVGNIVDQVVNTGVVTVSGTTLGIAQDFIFTATNTGLKLNLTEAVRKALNIPSTSIVPSNVKLSRVLKVEKVVTASPTDDTVLTVLNTYDVKNTTIQNNLLYLDSMLSDPTLLNLEFVLPSTQNNKVDVQTHNLPKIGDKIRVSFYYTVSDDSENLSYTRNGVLYTNKKFALINKIYISSGFKASQSTKFTATSFTQPSLGARYKVYYDYLAPKQNERISLRYNYNKIIGDVTFSIENNRPINADVLAKEAKLVLLDLTMNVVITDDFINSTTTVLQNLRDKLTAALTTTTLGDVVDAPTLINVAQAVNGIARARILYFNKDGSTGSISKFQAQDNEYFASNTVIINTETR
jgi:uncharacterized phage protein gp47/JayE